MGTARRATAALPILLALLTAPAGARDNFLVVVADDLGVDKLAVYSRDDLYGHPGEGADPGPTPAIDALAAAGVLFRNAWSHPTCAPARAALLTGRHAFRTGIGQPADAELPLSHHLLPEVLAPGHQAAAFGKWHLGPSGDDFHPNDSGFPHFVGALGGGLASYTSWRKVTNGSLQTNWPVYATSDNVDEALAWIAAAGESPWLVYLAFNAPHRPFHAPPASLHTQTLSGDPDDTPIPHYEAAVEAMDTELQRMLDGIPPAILADTTIVFLGDNGTPRQAVEAPFLSGRAKGSVYEGGVNVPLIVAGPHVPAQHRGGESLALVQVLDVFATLAEIASAAAPASDSVSLLSHLADPGGGELAVRPWVYTEQFSPNGFGPYSSEERAVRDDRYKLIWRDGVWEEMYDLDADPFEQDDLLAAPSLDPDAQAAFDALTAAVDQLHHGAALPAHPWAAIPITGVLLALHAARAGARGGPSGRGRRLRIR